MYNNYKQKIDEFKLLHKQLTAIRETSASPGELKQEITKMEADKEKLIEKINFMKKKFGDSVSYCCWGRVAKGEATKRMIEISATKRKDIGLDVESQKRTGG